MIIFFLFAICISSWIKYVFKTFLYFYCFLLLMYQSFTYFACRFCQQLKTMICCLLYFERHLISEVSRSFHISWYAHKYPLWVTLIIRFQINPTLKAFMIFKEESLDWNELTWINVPSQLHIAQLLQSCLTLCNTIDQASLSITFSWQEHWTGLPFPSPWDLPNPGIQSESPAL